MKKPAHFRRAAQAHSRVSLLTTPSLIAVATALSFASVTAPARGAVLTSGDVVGTPNVNPFLIIGNTAHGAMDVNGGSAVTSNGGASIGATSTGSGFVSVIQPGSRWNVAGDNGPVLEVGRNGGSGGLLINTGGIVETSAQPTGAPTVYGKGMVVGSAGGTGSIFVAGGGQLIIRDTLQSGFSEYIDVGGGFIGPGVGTLIVSGAGTSALVSGNGVHANLGRGAGSDGRILIDNGAAMTLNGNANHAFAMVGEGGTASLGVGSNASYSMIGAENVGLHVGRNGGSGTVAVNTGGTLNISSTGAGFGADINVGASYSPSTGSAALLVDSGGTVNIGGVTYASLAVGKQNLPGAKATISGVGSSVNLNGGNANLSLGQNGTTGSMTVDDGARFTANSSGAGAYAGVGGANSKGALSIVSGGLVELHSASTGNASLVVGDTYNGGGEGSLAVNSGGQISIVSDSAFAGFDVSSTQSFARARATVTGPGTTIDVTGASANATVGAYFHSFGPPDDIYGLLDLSNSATISVTATTSGGFFGIGAGHSSATGLLNLTAGASAVVAGTGYTSFEVGQSGGTGILNQDAAAIAVTTTGAGAANFWVGNQGTGSADVRNGSTIVVLAANETANLNVGNNAPSATMVLDNSSVGVTGGNAQLNVGMTGGSGNLIVSNDATIDINAVATAGFIGYGAVRVGDSNASGSLIVNSGGSITVTGDAGGHLEVGSRNGSGQVLIDSGTMTLQTRLGSTGSSGFIVGGPFNTSTGTGFVDIRNSGQLIVQSTDGDSNSSIGARDRNTAALDVSANGLVSMTGRRAGLTVGDRGVGTAAFTAGANFDITATDATRDGYLTLGYSGGTGTITVDGADADFSSARDFFISVGSPFGLQGGGHLSVTDGGSVTATSALGRSDLTIGTTALGQTAGASVVGNGNAFTELNLIGERATMQVGSVGAGSMTIASKGVVRVQGNLLSTTATIGTSGGTGTLNIDDARLVVAGAGSLNNAIGLTVGGTNSQGSVAVTAGGSIEVQASGVDGGTFASIGSGTGGVGSASFDQSVLNVGSEGGNALLNIGVGGGNGTVTLTDSISSIWRGTGSGTSRIAGISVGNTGSGTLNLVESAINVQSSTGGAQLLVGFSSPTLAGTGTLNIDQTSAIHLDSAGNNASAFALIGFSGSGTVTVDGGTLSLRNLGSGATDNAVVAIGINSSATNTLTVKNGGTVRATAVGGQGGVSLQGVTANAATVLVTGTGSLVEADDLIAVGSPTRYGDLWVVNGGVTRAQSVTVGALGRTGGDGTIDGSVTSAGTLDVFSHAGPGVAADFSVTGALTMTAGALNIDIFGTGAGQFDRLLAGGNAMLSDAAFNFVMAPLFTAQVGDVFRFLTYAGSLAMSNMSFSVFNGGGLNYALGSDATSVFLEVIAPTVGAPAPSAAALLAFGLAGYLARRRANSKFSRSSTTSSPTE